MFQISEQTWWEELDGIVIFYRTLIRLRLGHHGDSVAKAATKLLELLADFTHALLVLSGIAIVIAIVIEDVQLIMSSKWKSNVEIQFFFKLHKLM